MVSRSSFCKQSHKPKDSKFIPDDDLSVSGDFVLLFPLNPSLLKFLVHSIFLIKQTGHNYYTLITLYHVAIEWNTKGIEVPLLDVQGLKTGFISRHGFLMAVDEISFSLEKGQTLGIVGESGCGKSVTALSLMRLIPQPHGKIKSGKILFEDQDLLKLSEKQIRALRGNAISMIFQEPMTSLNPVFTIGDQIAEAIALHQRHLNATQIYDKTIEMLERVGISEASKRYNEYPHQLSGGMRQRVMIAMALSCDPQILIADEPTTALDVTIQAQILKLIKQLQQDMGTAVILITHDLGVVAETCDQVAVMYAGKIVEYTPATKLFRHPKHHYTQGLLDSIPRLETSQQNAQRLKTIPGLVPNLMDLPKGCRFQDRCPAVEKTCLQSHPALLSSGTEDHQVACYFPIPVKDSK